MLPVMGAFAALQASARFGVTPDIRPPGAPEEGRQLAALGLRTIDQRDALGQAAARVSGLAPLPAESSEAAGPTRPRAPLRTLRDAPRRGRPAAPASEAALSSGAGIEDPDELEPAGADRPPSAAPVDPTVRDPAARRGLRRYAQGPIRSSGGARIDLVS